LLEIGTNFLKLNVLEKKWLDLRGLTRSWMLIWVWNRVDR
jgi:hypothetical protein